MLFQHYYEHKSDTGNISFISFLKMHYLNRATKDADYEKDMKLPFKTPSQGELTGITIILPSTNSEILVPVYTHFKVNIPSNENRLLGGFYSSIWQPPKA